MGDVGGCCACVLGGCPERGHFFCEVVLFGVMVVHMVAVFPVGHATVPLVLKCGDAHVLLLDLCLPQRV